MIALGCLDLVRRVRARRRVNALLAVLQYGATDARTQINDTFVRGRAAQTLGLMGDRRAVEPLTQALTDADTWVRMAAAWALGRLGDARAVATLVEALDDEDWVVRTEVEKALVKLKVDSA